MSRIGYAPIEIPSGVTVEKSGAHIVVNGSKGKLELDVPNNIEVVTEGTQILVKRDDEQKKVKALHGLVRSLLSNMVSGVSTGWTKNLELVGVGFRAQSSGDKLVLNVGYSHQVEIIAPQGISFEVRDNTKISVSGIDKILVGQVAANVRKVREPEPYQGKGIRYEGEYIRRKAGKAGKVGSGAK